MWEVRYFLAAARWVWRLCNPVRPKGVDDHATKIGAMHRRTRNFGYTCIGGRADTGGSSALLDIHVRSNDGPPPHIHKREDEELSNSKYGINHLPGHDLPAGACTTVDARQRVSVG